MNANEIHKDYPLISVIIPVYNVEKYLRRCVDSVLAQTYPNIEIILVNDGSLDNSQAICEEYARTQPSVRALKKNNGGQSSARNFGLNSASGEYVGFIDSDDWIASDMYMHLYNLINKNDADVAQVECVQVTKLDAQVKQPKLLTKVLSDKNNILEYYLDISTRRSGGYSVCCCLIKTHIARAHRFREGKINEDMDWKYRVLAESRKLAVSNQIGYFYFQSTGSTTTSKLKMRDFDLRDAAEEVYKMTREVNSAKIRFFGEVLKARVPFSLLCRIAYFGIDDSLGNKKEIVKELIHELRHSVLTLLKAPLPINRKLVAIAMAINFNIVAIPCKILR